MPKYLFRHRKWRLFSVPPEQLQLGDLIFLKHKRSPRLVTHVAMALGQNLVFHCAREARGALIERIDTLFCRYSQPSKEEMISYIDPRSGWKNV
jgi:cell wall-associated NlpC family hydrolase